jgi:pimeloyl-ACP methyl ester carboxylesterase
MLLLKLLFCFGRSCFAAGGERGTSLSSDVRLNLSLGFRGAFLVAGPKRHYIRGYNNCACKWSDANMSEIQARLPLRRFLVQLLTLGIVLMVNQSVLAASRDIHYRTVDIQGVDIFYREAGDPKAPTILLLHGFPTSSHMFRDLIPLLADRYHLVAPDYPGFGYSARPKLSEFEYTFDHLADVMEKFVEVLGLDHYSLYAQDFGGPVGFRLAARHPERVRALIIQNANAYEEGVSQGVRDVVLRIWKERTPATEARLREFFELPVTKRQYLEGARDASLVSPDSWEHAQWGMDRPGDKEIQFALHANYGSNVERYDEWHAYFRKFQPPTLIVWGKGDFVFLAAGAEAYRKDLKHVELHFLDAGHFALETNAAEIASYIRNFQPSHN